MGSAPNSNTWKTGKNTWLEKVVPDTLPSVNRLSLFCLNKRQKYKPSKMPLESN